jgi:hypothetical protein
LIVLIFKWMRRRNCRRRRSIVLRCFGSGDLATIIRTSVSKPAAMEGRVSFVLFAVTRSL